MGGTERNRALSVGKVDVQRACNERLDGVAMVAKGDLASGPELSVLVAVKKGAGRGTEKSRTVGGVVGEVGKGGRRVGRWGGLTKEVNGEGGNRRKGTAVGVATEGGLQQHGGAAARRNVAAISSLYKLRATTETGKVAEIREKGAAALLRVILMRSDGVIRVNRRVVITTAARPGGGKSHLFKVGGGQSTLEARGAARGRHPPVGAGRRTSKRRSRNPGEEKAIRIGAGNELRDHNGSPDIGEAARVGAAGETKAVSQLHTDIHKGGGKASGGQGEEMVGGGRPRRKSNLPRGPGGTPIAEAMEGEGGEEVMAGTPLQVH